MQKAILLLQQRDKKLIDVARSVGYESDAAFSKAFKRVLGAGPGGVPQNSRDPVDAPTVPAAERNRYAQTAHIDIPNSARLERSRGFTYLSVRNFEIKETQCLLCRDRTCDTVIVEPLRIESVPMGHCVPLRCWYRVSLSVMA